MSVLLEAPITWRPRVWCQKCRRASRKTALCVDAEKPSSKTRGTSLTQFTYEYRLQLSTMQHAKPWRRSFTFLKIARLWLRLVLLVFIAFLAATSARPAKKYSCETCPVAGIDGRLSTPLGAVTKTYGCKIRKGTAELPMQDPECTPGAINPTVTVDIIRSGRLRTGCVRNCITTQFQKGIEYERYGVHKDRATCELDHLVPLELGGADSLDNIWPQCGPYGAAGLKIYFKEKNVVEDYFTTLVKTGQMGLRDAQEAIAKDWTQYRDVALNYCATQRCGAGQ